MTSLADAVQVQRLTRPIIGIENRTAQEVFDIMADRIRSGLRALDRASPEAVRDNVAVAIAECFLCQPKDMTWEDRSDELADAAIRAMELPDTAREAGR